MPAPNRNTSQSSNEFYEYVFYPKTGSPGPRTRTNLGTNVSYTDVYNVVSTRVPKWNRLKKSQIPWNPYSKHTTLLRDPLAFYTQKAEISSGYYIEDYTVTAKRLGLDVDPTQHPDASLGYPTQKVTSKIIEQVKLGQSQLGVAAAEAGKTAAHLAHTATRIYKAITALKKGRLGDFTSSLGITASRRQTDRFYTGLRKSYGRKGEGFRWDRKMSVSRESQEGQYRHFMAQTWLEYSYGWKPLLNDVYDQAQALATIFTDHQGCWRQARARGKDSKHTVKTITPTNQYKRNVDIKVAAWEEILVEYRIPNGVVNASTVFGLNNPLTIAWEVVPFSFVVDWFIPIGTALENMTAYQGLEFRRGISMRRYTYLAEGKIVPSGSPSVQGGTTYTALSSSHRPFMADMYITRSLLSDFPKFGMPRCKDPRSFAHAASAIALLQSLFLSGGSRQVKLR